MWTEDIQEEAVLALPLHISPSKLVVPMKIHELEAGGTVFDGCQFLVPSALFYGLLNGSVSVPVATLPEISGPRWVARRRGSLGRFESAARRCYRSSP